MAVIGINYKEFSPGDYESVRIRYGAGLTKEEVFASGDFVKDWYNCNRFIFEQNLNETETHFSNSSSVDHFIMDGAPFKSLYLYEDNGSVKLLPYEADRPGVEYFVKEGENPTWEELRAYCEKSN
jgi:hypothetical protein